MKLHCSLGLVLRYSCAASVEGKEGPLPGGLEPSVRYHSGRARILTLCQSTDQGTVSGRQFLWGVGLPKGNGGVQRFPRARRTLVLECKGRRELDCKTHPSSRDESRPYGSDGAEWKGRRSTDKSYSRDNRLIFPKSPHRREGLAPRCRLFATWGCSMFQGLGCSPIKAVRELGSERRETVRSISGVGVRALRGPFPSTRGPGRTHLWCTSYRAYGKRWVAKCGEDNC